MGQSQTKPMVADRLVNEHTSEKQEPLTYSFRMSSPKTGAPMLLTTRTTHAAHGTRFVYFQTPQPICLTDYNVIVCGASGVKNGNAESSTIDKRTFYVASLVYEALVVYKGVQYNQFVAPVAGDSRPPCRLLARFKSSKKSSAHSGLNTMQDRINSEQAKDRAVALKDTKMVWEFVWEVHSVF